MKRIEKDIRKNFKGDEHESEIVAYYFRALGGEGGCEECGDELCYECLQDLRRYQRKLNREMFADVKCRECGATGDFDNNGHCRSCH